MFWPNCKKGALAGAGFRLVYVDECDLHTHPHLAKVWQRRGQPVMVAAAGKDQRRAVLGAVDYGAGQVTWQLHPKKGGDAFAAFLDQIAQAWPTDHLILVLDNVSYHRAPVVQAWWAAQQGRITPLWLPVYTPNLNLMERVWRFLKQKLAGHRSWGGVDGLATAAATLLDHLEAQFHTPTRSAIHLIKNICRTA